MADEKCLFEQLWKDKEAVLKFLSKGPTKRKIEANFSNAVGDLQGQIEGKTLEIVAQYGKMVDSLVKSQPYDPAELITLKEDIAQRKQALVYLQELYFEFMGKELDIKVDKDEE